MRTSEVKALLQKYFEAETSLQEERQLKEYFSQAETDPELELYREFFDGLTTADVAERDRILENEIMDYILEKESGSKSRYRQMWLTVSGIAASLLIAVSGMLYYQQQQSFRDTFTDPDEALAYAQHTLQFISSRYNQGMSALEPVQSVQNAVYPLENSLQIISRGLEPVRNIRMDQPE
ncbi:MAG: hypothetical protein ACOZDD_05910 [Bacteroidota bacterium]